MGRGNGGLGMQSVTLNQNRDFRRVYARGRNRVGRLLVTYMMKNRLGVNRVGFTATKKVGKACARNRARRVMREAYRQLEPGLGTGYDIVFVARSATAAVKMQEVLAVMRQQLPALERELKAPRRPDKSSHKAAPAGGRPGGDR